ncbi:MAG TPA: DUF1259 domain-containing protein [bacterium]|nr:DUF1259 domain-containing protein [bacterium]
MTPQVLLLLTLLFALRPSVFAASPWAGLESTLGRPGMTVGNGTWFEFPRTDLNILVQGVPLDARGMLISRVSFSQEDKGLRMEACLFILESETGRVLAQAARNGLKVIGLYSPFPQASPEVRCLRLGGLGPPKELAWRLKLVLDSTGTPMTLGTPSPRPTAQKDPWADARAALGAGQEEGEDLLYQWGDFPLELRVTLQKEGNDLVLWGEFQALPQKADEWVKALSQKGFQVTTVTRRNDERPGVWIDFWCLNDEKKAIKSLASLLKDPGFASGVSAP